CPYTTLFRAEADHPEGADDGRLDAGPLRNSRRIVRDEIEAQPGATLHHYIHQQRDEHDQAEDGREKKHGAQNDAFSASMRQPLIEAARVSHQYRSWYLWMMALARKFMARVRSEEHT